MANANSTLKLSVDNSQYNKGLKESQKQFDDFARSIGVNLKQLTAAGVAIGAAAAAINAFTDACGEAINRGAELAKQAEGIKIALGNTPEKDGDGQKYKGRGYIQLTGLANYKAFNASDLCTEDVVKNPGLVAEFPLNQMASMWFWQKKGLNELADKDDGGKIGEDIVRQITKKVNGGQNGIAQRLFYYRRFKKEFGL